MISEEFQDNLSLTHIINESHNYLLRKIYDLLLFFILGQQLSPALYNTSNLYQDSVVIVHSN